MENDWPNAFNLSTVKSVEVVDDFTVDVKTTSPDPILFNRLAFAFIVSEKQFKEKSKDQPAVGTGPYKFVSLDKEKAILEANEDYYLGGPKIKKVVYKFYPEETTDEDLLQLLRKGEIDLASTRDENLSQKIGGDFQIKTITDPFIAFLFLDTTRDKSPYVDKMPNPLKNKLVRLAIYKTIDVKKLIEASGVSGVGASQLVTSAIFGYNPTIKRPEPNVEEARKLMEQAGVADGFAITLDIPVGGEQRGEAIAKDLEKIHIKVKVNPLTKDEGFKKIFTKKDTSAYSVVYGAETFDAGEIFTNVLHTPRGNFGAENLLGYSNAEIDKLAEDISTTFDLRERQSKLQNAMIKAMEEVPMIPFYSEEFIFVLRNNFDWTPTAFGAIYANEITGRSVAN